MLSVRCVRTFIVFLLTASAIPAYAQQTGTISGKVVDSSGGVLPGVTVEARSNILPTPRLATTETDGSYRLPALPPGNYTITFTLSGMQTVTRQAQVQLQQDTVVEAALSVGGLTESVEVTATASLIDRESATIKSGVSNEQIMALPVGQEYRDLVKLIPGVQFTRDQTRGPSAGGSGQDNVYQFDGVNVTLPLFGTLSAEPASHDIAQVTTTRGGARAIDFDRSGGFSIDSVSKSGTSRFAGMASFQFQNNGMAADVKSGSPSRYEQDRSWITLNAGGPILPDRLYFYGSYYRPERSRQNRANLYGELPDYESIRDEGFGKLTLTPYNSVLVNVSYRHSKRTDKSDLFEPDAAPTTGTGNEAVLKIGTAEGSWVINSRSLLTFKYTNFTNETEGRPDNIANATINTTPGTRLDINNLDQVGRLRVPTPVAGATDFNAFIQPLIDRYGYIQNGVRVGGGRVGYGVQFDDDDFFRESGQVGYNITLGGAMRHELHAGYQYYIDAEDLTRRSNGWGDITVPGGRLAAQPGAFYIATFQQQTTGQVPTIHSEYRSQTIELNDTIGWKNWTFNAGVLLSNDTLYGQGLREDSSTLSGYVGSPGTKYKMYDVPFSKLIQPRLGATWAYNGHDTIYGSFARYNPAASSLPRAASWDRNLAATIDARFDANGVLISTQPVASSSGKLFVEDLSPRRVDEYLIGTARQLNNQWSVRLYGRFREGSHFWEDTNNTARTAFQPPDELHGEPIPREPYISDLTARLAQIGSGSTYVIAELDGAYTKYREVTVESEWRGAKAFVRGSYTWSHYYGNFDQDNTTTDNDLNIFIGSSFIADGAGRQLWNFRDGDLRGDRPHVFKLYGYYMLNWQATAGGFFVAQSGQPWEAWSFEPYIALTTSTSDTSRYAEPAGSHRTESHYQLDLNYTQNIPLPGTLKLQLVADLYNVFDKQTGYSIQPSVHSSVFGQPRLFFDPRVFQLAARIQF
jgi:carboxypeptidase family protein